MIFIRIPLILVFVALLAACSDNQKATENKQATVQKELTPEEKFAKLQKEAEAGGADAQYELGVSYKKGEGIPKDADMAFEWFKKAADQGHVGAQYSLGEMYRLGNGVPKDAAKAMEWYQKAANQGNAEAQESLGTQYFYGFGVTADYTKAFEWYQKAAAQGNANAQESLGDMYAEGNGVPKNTAMAVELYQKAATQGHIWAQCSLGDMYAEGNGVPKDAAKAVEWYQKAAAQGNAQAQQSLSKMYWIGEGVSKNVILAYAWQNLATVEDEKTPAFPGQEISVRMVRDAMERQLTPAQRAEGQRLSSNWKKGDILQASSDSVPNSSASGGAPTKQGTGTGFVVSNSGHTLTNHHVVDGCKEIRVAGQGGVIKLLTSDAINDLALLLMPGKANVAPFTDNPANLRQGEDVVVFGYPLSSVLSSGGNLTPGTVSALSGLGNNTNQIQITAPIQPGSSGSPVLDKKGNVVGVVSMKLSDVKMVKATGSVAQNVNFAVNGQTVKAFLDTNKVSYKTGGGFFSREKSNADIAEDARKWTVVLECWK